MRILPSTALSVTHTDILSGNLSPHRPLPIGFCARARKSISNAFFAHFCCCCVAVDVRRLKQQKNNKKSESQTSVLGISIYNLVLHHVVLSSFCEVYLLFAAPAAAVAAAIVVSHSHSRCCCNFIGCDCVGVQPILCPQSNSLAHTHTYTLSRSCTSMREFFAYIFDFSVCPFCALCPPQPHRGKRPITFKCQLRSNGLKSL